MTQAARPKAPKNRLPFLEGIRGLAALYVVLGHICNLADPNVNAGRNSHSPEWLLKTMAVFSYGHIAVAAFIVLSGFCLELSLFARERGTIKSLKRFFQRRAQRILPPYYACLAISIYVAINITAYQVGLPFERYLPVDSSTVWAHIFLVHNFSLDWMYKINGVLWSIAIEVQLYFLFPILVLGVNKIGRIATLAIAGLVVYEAILLLPNAGKMYPWYLALFTGGIVSAHLAFRPTKIGRLPIVGSLFTIGCVYGCWYTADHSWPMVATDLFAGFGVAGLCYTHTASARGPVYRLLSWKPIVSLGAFSYSLYLMHHPIAQILYANRPAWAQGEVNLFWYLVFCLPLILFGCWVFYLLFEKPFMPRRSFKVRANPKDHAPANLPLRTYQPTTTQVQDSAT